MSALREAIPEWRPERRAQFDTLRLWLIRMGARMVSARLAKP